MKIVDYIVESMAKTAVGFFGWMFTLGALALGFAIVATFFGAIFD